MLFRKRRRREAVPPPVRTRAAVNQSEPAAFVLIDFDMMTKGAISTRKGTRIRQYCVTVGGSPRLVTSGDTVDRETYQALVAAGAVAPGDGTAPEPGA